jgi:hypothetical protein
MEYRVYHSLERRGRATRSRGTPLKRGYAPPRCTLDSAILREFFTEKWLELKIFKGRTKVEELRQLFPQFLSLRPPLKTL